MLRVGPLFGCVKICFFVGRLRGAFTLFTFTIDEERCAVIEVSLD